MGSTEVMESLPAARDRQSGECSGVHILVVDDDEWIRELIGMALTDEGYVTETAPNGAAALRLLEELARDGPTQPDLILLDMRMPVMDGWAFVQAHRDRRLPPVPIVVITAAADPAQCAADVGADGALAKPFTIEELLAAVHAVTRARSRGA